MQTQEDEEEEQEGGEREGPACYGLFQKSAWSFHDPSDRARYAI